MAESPESRGSAVERHELPPAPSGIALISDDRVENPGLPPHRPRVSDVDPKKERANERRVAWWFFASIAGSLFAVVAYFAFPIIPG